MAQNVNRKPDIYEPVDLGNEELILDDEETVMLLDDADLEDADPKGQEPLDDPELARAGEMLKQPPPRKSEVRKRVDLIQEGVEEVDYRVIDPSTDGWEIIINMGTGKDRDSIQDIRKIQAWRKSGDFTVSFQVSEYGEGVVRIRHRSVYADKAFRSEHMSVFDNPNYRVAASAPSKCVRQQKIRVVQVQEAVQAKTEAALKAKELANQKKEKARKLFYLQFTKFTIYISAKRVPQFEARLDNVAALEGFTRDKQKISENSYRIIFTKGQNPAQQMVDPNHAVFFASFNPDIE